MNKYYWLVMLDNISDMAQITALVCSLICGIGGVVFIITTSVEGEWERWKVMLLIYMFAFCFSLSTVAVLIPNTKQMAAIYLLPKVVENKNITSLPDNMAKLANEWIEELSPKKKEARP